MCSSCEEPAKNSKPYYDKEFSTAKSGVYKYMNF